MSLRITDVRKSRNRKPEFVLRVSNPIWEGGTFAFCVVKARSAKPAKLSDVERCGFYVQPCDAAAVLELVARQIEVENAELRNARAKYLQRSSF